MTLREYIDYIRDNPEGYWFKARWYGWGWVPATRQGWLVLLVFVVVLIANSFYFEYGPSAELSTRISDVETPLLWPLMLYIVINIISVLALLWICYKKGEKPHWSWGNPRSK